ncbi:SspB family protein [Jannaschia sp. LMIT008]|uniref:SspB family protein n=1 Tax=Jannaschia maritima TaxID=3032585 RepID=UPI002810F1E2|nr:ClpXP protease specificity-enhancing factor SspB [Jannaschia sp. LMIT008]
MADRIDYGRMMHDAMRQLIARVLRGVAQDGLPGDHHFFVTFDTTHPDVGIADWLRERYPEEMTVVLQHWFDALEVRDDGFSVTLNFGDTPEPLSIPWDSLRTFVDPSVEFGLRFEAQEEDAADDDHDPEAEVLPASVPAPAPVAKDPPKGDAEVVQLDKFRK